MWKKCLEIAGNIWYDWAHIFFSLFLTTVSAVYAYFPFESPDGAPAHPSEGAVVAILCTNLAICCLPRSWRDIRAAVKLRNVRLAVKGTLGCVLSVAPLLIVGNALGLIL
jgi:hypothetical protein